MKVESPKEAVEFIRSRPKPLALYIFSNDTDVQNYIINHTSSGGVCINDCLLHNSVPTLPFGGGKKFFKNVKTLQLEILEWEDIMENIHLILFLMKNQYYLNHFGWNLK